MDRPAAMPDATMSQPRRGRTVVTDDRSGADAFIPAVWTNNLVELSPQNLAEAKIAAALQQTRYGAGPYGRRQENRQETGRLGEEAAAAWLRSLGAEVKPHYRRVTRATRPTPDIGAALGPLRLRIEVKSSREASWVRFGPCLSAYQLSSIASAADVILFMTVEDAARPGTARVRGWIRPSDAALGRPYISDDLRAQVALEEQHLVAPDSLWSSPLGAGPDAPQRCSTCGACTPLGLCWRCCEGPAHEPRDPVQLVRDRPVFHVATRQQVLDRHPILRTVVELPFRETVAERRPCLRCLDESQ